MIDFSFKYVSFHIFDLYEGDEYMLYPRDRLIDFSISKDYKTLIASV